MEKAKYLGSLTHGETMFLLGLCIVPGIAVGAFTYLLWNRLERWLFLLDLLVMFLGPGTWFVAFCGFGTRGPERRACFRGTMGWFGFNLLTVGVGILTFVTLWLGNYFRS